MDYYELAREIDKKKIHPVYLFWGEEDYLIEDVVKKITETVLEPESLDFNLDVFYGNEIQGSQVLQAASSYPFMGEYRLVIVKDVQRLKPTDVDVLNHYLKRPSETTCLVLIATKLNFKLKHYKNLKANSVSAEFKTLYDRQIPGWIKDYLQKKGYFISEEAVRLLQENVGLSLRALVNELEKIFLNLDQRTKIESDDIRRVVGLTRGYSVFELSNFIGAKQLDAALSTITRMLELGESPLGIITMLSRFFSILVKVKHQSKITSESSQIAAKVGVPPFFLKDYLTQSKNFTSQQLQETFHLLLKADVDLKSSAQKPRLILELLIYQLIKGNKELSI